MAIEMYKGTNGWSAAAQEQTGTHVLLSKKEYHSLKQQLQEEKDERQYQEELNRNLLRISKERSNADRFLDLPKKHSGYVVKYTQEKTIKYLNRKKEKESFVAWETLIQSPYTLEFTEAQARKQIDKDLTPSEGTWLIKEIGIDIVWYTDIQNIMRDKDCEEQNVAFEKFLKLNFRAGYWEVKYVHTKPLGIVPKTFLKLPEIKQQSKKKPNINTHNAEKGNQ